MIILMVVREFGESDKVFGSIIPCSSFELEVPGLKIAKRRYQGKKDDATVKNLFKVKNPTHESRLRQIFEIDYNYRKQKFPNIFY